MWDVMHDFYIARPQEKCQLKIFKFSFVFFWSVR